MAVTVDHWEDLGDATVRVYARTPLGEWCSVVVGRDKLGSADMHQILDAAARSVDKIVGASRARASKSEWED